MTIGKLSNSQLESLILKKIKPLRPEVLVRPSIGKDCAVIDFGEYVAVLSTDPITGTAEEIGRLAVHINCNDIATTGTAPLGIMITLLAPIGTTPEVLGQVMTQAAEAAEELNVEIIGGHTEITSAVNRLTISATAIGKREKNKNQNEVKPKAGDKLLLTKSAGLEGTGILIYEREEKLSSVLDFVEIIDGKAYLDRVSVVREGIIAGKHGIEWMHDVTEGGVLGAVWEMCHGAELGCIIDQEAIPISAITRKVCFTFGIDPLRLISSGCMLMCVPSHLERELIQHLTQEGIPVCEIGELTSDKKCLLKHQTHFTEIEEPFGDELYVALG